MKQQVASLRFNQNQQAEVLSDNRKKGLLTGLLAGSAMGFFIDSLETGADKDQLLEVLSDSPWLKNEGSITEMLQFLHDEGDRTAYAFLLPHLLSAISKEDLENVIRKRFFGVEQLIRYANNLYYFLTLIKEKTSLSIEKTDLERGILAWDMGRLTNLARIAHETTNITQEEAWNHIEFAGEQCRKSFKNWEEMGKSYLLGQAMKSNKDEDFEQTIALYLLAADDEKNLWKESDYLSLSTT